LPWRHDPDGSTALASPKKETRSFNGREYVLETGIVTDFALVRASIGDRHGNLVFHQATRNFNPLCAMAGKFAIAEVEELVEPGEIDPEQVHLPGIYVQRVVEVGSGGKRIERVTIRKRGAE
jgi:3-oxoacid CoA-transferase subunit A